MVEPELGARKVAVLRAVVEEYVRTGEPVGSETIAEQAGLGVSSATIRNEMSALEELGYPGPPPPSAGRIPTDVGYRKYVDPLPPGGKMRDTQRRAIAGFFAETMLDLEEVLKGTTQLLSRVTQYAGLAVPPSGSGAGVVRSGVRDGRLVDRFRGRPVAGARADAWKAAAESRGTERDLLIAASDVFADLQAGAGAPHVMIGGGGRPAGR